LIASPLIPLNTNVLRLADAIDNEGVVNQTNNIVVRFVGSSSNVTNKIPLIYDKKMQFELNFSCQNYLSSSGHDFATQLLMGSEITISGGVPSGSFVQVIEPFHCASTQFTGINKKSSQYTYTQLYTVTVQEVYPYVALDPCVQRGDCRQLFPGLNVSTTLPLGGVLDEASGSIYTPWYPGLYPPEYGLPDQSGIKWSNEVTQSGDWVFACDPTEVFIEDPLGQPIYLLSNNSYTEDGRLVVTIWDAQTKQPLKEVFYADSGKKLARYAVELWRNTLQGATDGNGGISPDAIKEASFFQGMNTGEFAVVKGAFQIFYSDPLNPEAKTQTLSGGSLIGVKSDVFIQAPKGRFYFVGQSPLGKGWLLDGSFELASMNSLWKLGCGVCQGGSKPLNSANR
jgi:hypothetical protein